MKVNSPEGTLKLKLPVESDMTLVIVPCGKTNVTFYSSHENRKDEGAEQRNE